MRRAEIRVVSKSTRYIMEVSLGPQVFLQTGTKQRADERTRTAFLLFTSDNLCVAGVCLRLQMPRI
jgi:hypothetical protein